MDEFKSYVNDNPVMILFLGACPALAATATVKGSLGMGLAVCAILFLSTLVMTLLKKLVEDAIRLPLAILISAGFASMAQMIMAAFLPSVYSMLGVYVAVCAINAMVVREEEVVGAEESVGGALKDALIAGLEFVLLLFLMGVIREVLGAGSFLGAEIAFLSSHTIPVLAKAPGAFLVFAVLLAVCGCFSPKEAE